MKILQINCSSNGSTGNLATAIHKGLLQHGEESIVAYGMGPNKGENFWQISNPLDYRFHTYMGRVTGMHGYFSVISTKKFLKLIDTYTPEIVHLHNLHGGYLNLPLLFDYLKAKKQKTILTLHDCWLFTGGCAYYTSAHCYKWQNQCEGCPELHSYPKSYFFDTSTRCQSDKKAWFSQFTNLSIVTVSNWLKAEAKKSFLGEYPIDTIYNGIDTIVFSPRYSDVRRRYHIPDNKKMILGVASLWNDARKGFSQFLELSQKLSNNTIIVLVGLTERQISSLPSNVIGVRRTESREELAELYSSADVFINMSKEETFGLVTAEAMACGTPCIVSTETASPEVITNETGIAVNTDDVEAICAATAKIMSKPKDYYSYACIARASNQFSETYMVEQYLTAYEKKLYL